MFELPWIALFVICSPLWWGLVAVATCMFWWAMEYDSGRGGSAVLILTAILMTCFGGLEVWQWLGTHPVDIFGYTVVYGVPIPGLLWDYFAIAVGWGVARWLIYCRDDRAFYDKVKTDWLDARGFPDIGKIPAAIQGDWMDFCLNNHETRQWIRVVRDDTLYQYTQLRTKWLQNRSPNDRVHEDQKVNPAQQQEWMEFLANRFPKFVQVAQAYEFTNTEMPLERHVLSVKQKARNHKSSIITWMVFWPWSLTWWLIRDLVKNIGKRLYNLVAKWLDKISDWVYQGVDDDFNTIQTFTNVKTITLENKNGDTSREVNVK